MRKILYLFLSFAVAVTALCVPIAAEEAPVPEAVSAVTFADDAVGYLKALGADWLEDADLTAPTSRKEFARLVCLIGGYTADTENGGFFLDVESPEDSSAADFSGYINALANVGIVSKDGGWFEPDRNITKQEAATMLVRVLGYQYLADEKGGFPTGYMMTASNLSLFDGVDGTDDGITMDAAVRLCVNALDTDMMVKIAYGEDAMYKKQEGHTLAYDVFGIVHYRGAVNAVDLSALKGANPTNPYYMTVDGIDIYVNDFETAEYLGYGVDVFYKYDKGAGRNSLIWIYKSADNDELVVDVEDIKSISDGVLEYYTADGSYKTKTKSYNILSPLIYNGVATSKAFNKDILQYGEEGNKKDKQGKVRLLDNNNDGKIDVIFADVYTNLVAGTVNKSENRVYDANNSSRYLDLDTTTNYPYTVIYNNAGDEITAADVAKGSILSVFDYQDDADQGYLRAYVSNETASGTIDKIIKKDGILKITVGGSEYSVTDDCEDACKNMISAGSQVILKLDYYGYCADIDASDALSFGYIIAAKRETGISGRYLFKLLTADGQVVERLSALKIGVDNVNYKDADADVLNRLLLASHEVYPSADPNCTAQPIRYRLNDKGEVAYIDTVYNKAGVKATADTIESDDALYIGTLGNYRYRESGYIFGGKFIAKTSTVFLGCPMPGGMADYIDGNKYMYVTVKNMVGGTYYDAVPLFVTENPIAADYVVYDNEKSAAYSETTGVSVVKSVERYWENDTDYTKLTVADKTGEVGILCEDDFTFSRGTVSGDKANALPDTMKPTDLKAGDVIRYSTNARGYVNNITLYYRIDGGFKVNTSGVSEIFNASFSLRKGYALKKTDDGFSFVTADSKEALGSATDDSAEIIPVYSGCTYIVYDGDYRDGDVNVKVGSYEDIIAYKDSAVDCTQLMVHTNIGTPYAVIIIK